MKNFSKYKDTQKLGIERIGLGLTICKEIIEDQMKSQIEYRTGESGRGTDFVVTIKTQSKVHGSRLNEIREAEDEKGSSMRGSSAQ